MALFYVKFVYILAIRYPIFRWDLCKSCVWESMKKTQDVCNQRSLAIGSHDWLTTGKLPKWHTCEVCRELMGHNSWRTTGKNVQTGQAVSSQLIPLARLSCQNALFGWKLTFHIPHIYYYKYSYTHEI